jgi:hypothetical protein
MTYDTNPEDNVTIMANVGVTFEDGDTLSLDNAMPGDSVSKTFTVTNSSDSTALFSIDFSSITNTFVNNDIVYSLYEVVDNKDTVLVSETALPSTTSNITSILDCTSIEKNTSKTYKLVLLFKETNTDQSVNMGKEVSVTLSLNAIDGTRCPTGAEKTAKLLSTLSDTIVDETDDKNIRYIGANPNNYIWFNCEDYSNPTEDTCERWRIIGVMNNVSTDNGTESLVKIVRASFIGNYAWDRTSSSYSNVWETSTIKSLLNDTYYNNGTSTQYYGSTVSTKTAAFDGTGDTKGITSATKNLIQEVNWNVTSAIYSSTAFTMYNRTGTTSKINIGLIDSADYGFATSGGDTGRSTCLGVNLYDWDATAQTDCRTNSWLWYSNPTSTNLLGTKSYYWTIRPYSGNSGYALGVYSYGYVGNSNAYNDLGVRPALFLKSSVLIQDASGEDGSYNSPYVIRTSA